MEREPRNSQPCVPLPSAVLRGSLEHGMLVCLGLLRRNPDCFDAAAAAWHARWCELQPGLGLRGSRAALAALEMMASGSEQRAGAQLLSRLCRRNGLDDVAAVLDAWLEKPSQLVDARHAVAA
jgi:hypothetical protein